MENFYQQGHDEKNTIQQKFVEVKQAVVCGEEQPEVCITSYKKMDDNLQYGPVYLNVNGVKGMIKELQSLLKKINPPKSKAKKSAKHTASSRN